MVKFQLFQYLRWKNDKSNLLSNTHYKRYYDQKAHLFSKYPGLAKYDDISSDFALIKAVIILKALNNKMKIEEDTYLYQEADLSTKEAIYTIHDRLPYYETDRGVRIYVPFFTEIYNKCYNGKLSSLLIPPYNTLKVDFINETIDPFDYYGYDIFDSYFTNLLYISKSKEGEIAAFYSIELETIYVIDNQGCLEEKIPIFDDELKSKTKDHLIEYLSSLMSFYFDSNKNAFIDCLYNYKLISNKSYQYIVEKESEKEDR